MFVKNNMSIREIHNAYTKKELSPESLIKERLNQIEKINNKINCIVAVNELAINQMNEIKYDNLKQEKMPRLYGIPITIKDNMAVKGMKATAGYLPLKDFVPQEDAIVVKRLKEEGAIILGKTNLAKLAMDAQTDNEIYGRTNNPYNIEYCAGGSSGGSAAAVVAGISNADIGNDLLGSIRIPASYCGAFSLTPTEHVVPHVGIIPEQKVGSLLGRFFRIGVLAGRIEDLEPIFRTMIGYSELEPSIPPINFNASMNKPQTIGILHNTKLPVERQILELIASLRGRIANDGIIMKDIKDEQLRFDELTQIFNRTYMTMIGRRMPKLIRFIVRFVKGIKSLDMSLIKYIDNENKRLQISTEYELLFKDIDIIMLPATGTTAFKHMKPDKYQNGFPIYKKGIMINGKEIPYDKATTSFTIPLSVVGNPVVTVPIGFSDKGLPISIQLVGRKWNDINLIKMAEYIYSLTDHYKQNDKKAIFTIKE
jgi:amidase